MKPSGKRGQQKKYNWDEIRKDYVENPTSPSLRDLEEKFGCPHSCIQLRAREERWVDLRKDHRHKVGTKAAQKTVESQAATLAQKIKIVDDCFSIVALRYEYLLELYYQHKARGTLSKWMRLKDVRELGLGDLNTMARLGTFLRGGPDSRQGWRSEPAMTQEEADVLLRALARVEEDKDEHRRALHRQIGASPYETQEPGKAA